MTNQGAILITVLTTALALWMMSLVRRGRLYIGYAVVCLVAFALIIVVVAVKPLRGGVEAALEYFFPRSGLAVALGLLGALALIYVLSQLTIITNRLARAVQKAAVREALTPATETPADDSPPAGSPRDAPASTPRTAQIET